MNNYNFKGKKILIVDDDLPSAILASHILKKTGAEVFSVGDGAHAVDKVAKESIDMILMDFKMPVMDGYEATQKIRAMGKTMPIIGYSACAMPDEIQKGIDAGCIDYLVKPVTPETFLDVIGKYLK